MSFSLDDSGTNFKSNLMDKTPATTENNYINKQKVFWSKLCTKEIQISTSYAFPSSRTQFVVKINRRRPVDLVSKTKSNKPNQQGK